MTLAHQPMTEPSNLTARYREVRARTEYLCEPLEIEDYLIQPMADASPPKWHLAHVSWFFETFLLKPGLPGYQPFDPLYEYLFNSYYQGVGKQFDRASRGHLSRPTVEEIYQYRRHVDEHMLRLLETPLTPTQRFQITLGLNHEQQHQELLLTDLKYNLGRNPIYPVYRNEHQLPDTSTKLKLDYVGVKGGIYQIGAEAKTEPKETETEPDSVFFFDNESPRHDVLVRDYSLANRLVTNREYLEFMNDGGYERFDLWLSDGWALLQNGGQPRADLKQPLYWVHKDGQWFEYRLDAGLQPLVMEAPVCHVSGYEADAFARWAGARLPTEAEWEVASVTAPRTDGRVSGNFVEAGFYHPAPASGVPNSQGPDEGQLHQMFGDVWQWTSSAYGPYPGFKPFEGALGEYNGKFMANQLVLRGASCATPMSHCRNTYRNFFYPPDRWQFTGIRLARDEG